ncbi:MAG: hypothetical protein ACK4NZ_14535 [Tsuneonella sp.]
MWWLLDLFSFVRDYEGEWGTLEARRRSVRRILVAVPILVALVAIVTVIAINLG